MGGICSAPCLLSSIMAGTVSTDAVTSVEHQTDTENITGERGAPMSNSSESLHTTGSPTRSLQSKDIMQLFVCVVTK